MRISGTVKNIKQFISPRGWLLGATGWITIAYVVQQILRIATSLALAWILAPRLLGIMLLINTLRTGGELLTDIGIGQSIVNNTRGDRPEFYNTAWTIQVLRGLVLLVTGALLSVPLASLYNNADLHLLLPVASVAFLISGMMSPGRFMIQRYMRLKRLALFDMTTYALIAIIQVCLAAYSPTIWALIAGLLVAVTLQTMASFALLDLRAPSFVWDRQAAHEIIHFGKWIFASSLIYFAALNFDRLYLAKLVTITMLGVYGVARSYVDAILLLFQRLANLIVFPKISSAQLHLDELRRRVLPLRLLTTMAAALGLAFAVALADQFILFAYDERYRIAATFLPILLVGTWFAILAVLYDAMMLGIGKPSSTAWANAGKLLFIAVVVPNVLPKEGMIAAVGVFALAELARYAVLVWRARASGLSFFKQDMLVTVVFFASILAFRGLANVVGLGGGLAHWGA